MNSQNCAPGPSGLSSGAPGCPVAGTPVPSYGVRLGEDNNFTGYAWSEHIGWINFQPAICGIGSAPPDCNAPAAGLPANLSGTLVEGWIRALLGGTSDAGGWDGWILMGNGSWPESVSVTIDSGNDPSGHPFAGYAWGGDVVGWVDFSGVSYVPPPSGSIEANGLSGNVALSTADPVTLTWDTEWVDSCEVQDMDLTVLSTDTDGSLEVGPLTEDETYYLICDNGSYYSSRTLSSVSITVSEPLLAPMLSINRRVARYEDTIRVSWDTLTNDPALCVLDYPGGADHVPAEQVGFLDVDAVGSGTFELTCAGGSVTAVVEFELVPSFWNS